MRFNLILWEKEMGLKAKDIAKKLGISEAMYSNIKRGKTTPNIKFVYKFREVFPNVDVLELLKK